MKRRRRRLKSWILALDRQDLEPSIRNIRPVSMNSLRSSLHPTRYHPPKRGLPPHKKPVTAVAAEQYGRLFLAACLMLALFAPIFLLAGAFAYFQLTPRVVPGVYSGDIRLGGLTVDQAAIRIHSGWNLMRKITVTDGYHTWQVSPADMGLEVDPVATARGAYVVGHTQDLASELAQMIHSASQGWGVAPVYHFDASRARSTLLGLSDQVSRAAVDASIRLQGDQFVAVAGVLGYTFNLDDCMKRLSADPQSVLLGAYFKVSLQPVSPRLNDVSGLLQKAQAELDHGFSIDAYDPIHDSWKKWEVPRGELGKWIRVSNNPQDPQLSLDEGQIKQYVSQLDGELGSEEYLDDSSLGNLDNSTGAQHEITLLVKHHPTSYTVQAGDTLIKIGWKVEMPYWRIIQANPGLNPDKLVTGQELIIPSKDDLLPLPVDLHKRIILSISQQRLWAYQDGKLLSEHIISTGIDRSPTQPGVFQVQTHEINAYASVWDLYMPNFLGIYEAWPGFMNGIHGLPTLSNGQRLWANILGRPASYGCIILDLNAAKWLYQWAENGVVVEIRS
jgi:LysM repeat protein